MKTLVVAEKPSVGRDIARVLKADKAENGFLYGDNYIVTWAIGHLVSLQEPDELDEKYSKWNKSDLPILPQTIPLKVLAPTKLQFEIVKRLMNDREVDRIICATDSGREGELIFRYIYLMAGCTKSFDRLWISSMTDAAIKAGFDSLKPSKEYDALYASARCRSEADWLVGMNATRAFTLRYSRLLSVGRVQTPTLALIVRRDAEISAFVPEEYCELTGEFEAWKGTWFDAETKSTHIKDRAAADEIARRVKGKTGKVAEVRCERKSTPPERLYDLTTLQREANRKFGFSADKTLKIAQSLYETHKLITYPRTDSRFLPDDMIPKVRHTLSVLPEPYAALVRQAPLDFAKRIYDNARISDHHAIIPTDRKGNLSRLTQDEAKIFDLVAKRLISNHYGDYIYDALGIITQVGADQFKTDLNAVVDMGWKAVYAGDDSEKTEHQANLPEVKENAETKLVKTSIRQKKTTPPARYTDDTLLKAMEDAGKTIEDEELREKMKDAGLGTPATRAAIIQRLIEVGYAKREKKNLISTIKGQKLIQVVPAEISNAVTTGKWERALAKMARLSSETEIAEKQDKFMNSIRTYSAFLTEYALHKAPKVDFPREERKGNGRKTNATRPKTND
ncbi:MAG: DNA topoisomerase 3 [Clostridiales bacterium]|nr:DNA topoisomerase 3 [Clostridiales bacterium]